MLGRLLLDIFKHGPARALASGRHSALYDQGEVVGVPDILSLDDINYLVKAKHGWFLANSYDHYLGKALIRYGECCEIEHDFLTSLISDGDSVIEVGSNIGVHTVGLSKAVGSVGRVVAIEVQPAIFQILCANLALNALFNVTTHACGCSDRKGAMIAPAIDYSASSLHNSGAASLASTGVGTPVSVIPLDELVEDIHRLRLIKIDVEGMEQQVLQGANRLIAKHRPLLYVENDRVEKSKALIEWIMSAGYQLWWHIPPLFNPNNHFGIEENDYPSVVSVNMICHPREAALSIPADGLIEITSPDHHPLKG